MKVKNITENMRVEYGLSLIEEISCHAESLDPQRDWKQSSDAISEVFRIAHALNSTSCRKNHPSWCQKIDDIILGNK